MNRDYVRDQDAAKHQHLGGTNGTWALGDEIAKGELRLNHGGLFMCLEPHIATAELEPIPTTSSLGTWTLEAPTGAKNGTNKTFTIPTATPTDNVLFFWNGQLMTEGVDFTISGVTITWLGAVGPTATDYLLVFYPH